MFSIHQLSAVIRVLRSYIDDRPFNVVLFTFLLFYLKNISQLINVCIILYYFRYGRPSMGSARGGRSWKQKQHCLKHSIESSLWSDHGKALSF